METTATGRRERYGLDWLPDCPDDYARHCREALSAREEFGTCVRRLAGCALDDNRLIRLSRTIAEGRSRGFSLAPLAPYRLGVAGNGTLQFLVPAIAATSPRHGMAIETVLAGYDQALQSALAPDSPLYREQLDFVLIALEWRALGLCPKPGDPAAARAAVESALDHIDAIRDAVHRNSGAVCIVQNLAPPPERQFGSLDRALPGTLRSMIDAVNAGLVARLQNGADRLFDVAGLAETVGLAAWHSPSQWNLAKLPFAQEWLPLYADHVCRILGAIRGLSRRCLVLDLDNTLWGGVIGDDGLNGIHIGQGDPAGEAHLDFQRYVLSLRERGVVLAICSKNEDEAARLPFRSHPDMLLREEHFAVFQANWADKATNIQAIADTLSLGLDSLAFADDNPFERNLVREALPQVAVPELPGDPADFSRVLSAAGYFEAAAFSGEDLQRAEFYAGNARRALLERQVGDLESYLADLAMETTLQPFDPASLTRITQLINKSNQFNLTTRRYTELEVAEMAADPGIFTLQIRLSDRLGDNGMISVIICRPAGDRIWEIDTWLMSCRVLGRRVEEATLHELIEQAKSRGIRRLRGVYIPTVRNKLVERHYERLGFRLVETQAGGATVWEFDVAEAQTPAAPPPIQVRRLGWETPCREAVPQ